MDGFDGDMRDMLGCASHVEVCGMAGICGICGMDHLPENRPAPLPFLARPPLGEMGTANTHQNDTIHKKECFFLFNRLIHSVLIHYFNIRLLLLVLIMYNH